MARIIHDDQGGSSSAEGHLTVIQAEGQTHLQLPEGDFMSKGDILRDGQDLVLQSSDGQQIVVEGYFSAMPAPTLTTPQGSMLTPELVESFVKSSGPIEMAANGTENDASAVGIVKEISGDATVTRADGTSEKATLGMDIHQGDIIETAAEGAVNIVFLDESTFAISNNARMAIDEYVFDPATQAGETNVSILRGMFVFTSGLIGRDDPDDVTIETPVGSIGIRGTTIAGNIVPDGQSQITVVEGAIVIKNGSGEVTLATQYETVNLTGFDAPIQVAGTLDANQMRGSYGIMGTVAPAFMNTLNTEPAEAQEDAPAEEAPADTAPVDAPATGEQGQAEAEQPVMASYDIFSDPLNTGFDLSTQPTSDNPFDTNTVAGASLLGSTGLSFMSGDSIIPVLGKAPNANAEIASLADAPAPLPPLEVVVEIFVDDDALAGDVVGKVFTTIAYPNVQIKFANVPTDNGEPVFELVMVGPGVYNVILTDAGEDALATAAGASASSLGDVEVVAMLPDGRTTAYTATSNYGDYTVVTPPPTVTPAGTLALDSIAGADGDRVIGGAGQGLGQVAAYLGDYNNSFANSFALTTDQNSVLVSSAGNLAVAGSDLTIAGNGDVNGDGYLDFVIGNPFFNTDQGQVSIHSGLNPAAQATTNAGAATYIMGSSVAMTDFNGDGFADVFVGSKGAGGTYGNVSIFEGTAAMTFAGGVTLTPFANGTASFNYFGMSMTSLQDYNNDGFGDLAVAKMTSTTSGVVTLFMGNAASDSAAPITITVAAVDAYDIPLYDLGDVNGDGRSDLLIGETGYNADGDGVLEGRALISFGGSNGAIGMTITSNPNSTLIGGGSAGDFNGDGYDDIFIATQTGNTVDAYVVYGGIGLAATIMLDPTWAANNPGSYYHMTLDLTAHGLPADFGLNSLSIGDQNDDGFEDLLISSEDLNGGNGGYYVVYGRADPFDLAGPDPEVHSVADNTGGNPGAVASSNYDGLVGDGANNNLSNLNGNIYTNISFQAGNGNDLIRIYGTGSNLARVINGGDGMDSLAFSTAGNIDLRNISELSGIEEVSFEDPGVQILTIGLNDIFTLMQTSAESMNVLGQGNRYTVLFGDASAAGGKQLVIDDPARTTPTTLDMAGFNNAGIYTDGGGNDYTVYTFGSGYQLLIDTGISVTLQ